ncbi:MAG TPA: HYR domain-containing protein, partial [Rhodothermia bacterium]|nr:HYR domain-containing protein [Rhodothermia bacterium]
EVSVDARDPQDDPLFGSIEFFDPDAFVMPNVLEAPDVCSAARFGSGPGEGILYVNFDGQPILVDLSLSGMCGSSQPVFWFASGKCAHPDSAFDSSFQIALPNATMPISICVALFPSYDGSFDLTVLGFDEQAATVSLGESLALSLPIDSGLPPISDISSLRSGTRYRMLITVGDGTTRAARAERRFLYRGERTMRIDFPTGDSDGDGFTDASDSCTDSDRDGFGNPGFPANTCPPDNCPLRRNSEQVETDGDGVGDMCDNCPETINPMQEDSDRDSEGNACDPCPQDAQGDLDGDGVCREIDNCPAADNPGQEDTNADGSGDSCQPSLILVGVAQHGGDALEVIVSARDPQNDSLTGSVEITTLRPITLPDVLFTSDCGQGFLPEGVRGEGVGFTYGFVGTPFLFDLDTYMGCYDFLPDYLIARGTCSKPTSSFENAISLADFTPPAGVCIYRVGSSKAGIDLRILEFDSATFMATIIQPVSVLRDELDSLLRAQIDISMLEAGQTYRLVITVTDGTTLPVSAESTFVPHGESKLVFAFPNSLPQARVTAAATTVECVNSSGGAVVLDASASTDPDSTPGTNDDIVAFEWFENYGLPTQSYLGSGAILDAQLSLGSHTIGLRVTDSEGATSAAGTVVTVRDTIPPVLHCPATASAECAGLDGSPVSLFATATDMCGGVTITSSRGGADATGTYPPGDTQVSFMATDASGNPASCVTDVTVRDTTPPVIAVTVEPASLWPPNHRL